MECDRNLFIFQGQLEGVLNSPTAPDYIHIFFSSLGMVSSSKLLLDSYFSLLHCEQLILTSSISVQLLPRYPADVPPTVVSPLLTVATLRLLSQVVDPEEDNLWRSLGDSWNVPR